MAAAGFYVPQPQPAQLQHPLPQVQVPGQQRRKGGRGGGRGQQPPQHYAQQQPQQYVQQQPQQKAAALYAQPDVFQQQSAGAKVVVQPGKQADWRWSVMVGGNPHNPTASTKGACAKQAPCFRNHAYKP